MDRTDYDEYMEQVSAREQARVGFDTVEHLELGFGPEVWYWILEDVADGKLHVWRGNTTSGADGLWTGFSKDEDGKELIVFPINP
jgi:hypothetical protein